MDSIGGVLTPIGKMPKTLFCTGFTGNYNGVYWYVVDSIGGVLNPIGKMPKTHNKNEFCNGFTGKS